MSRLIVVVLVLFAGYQLMFHESEVSYGPGVIAPKTPSQRSITDAQVFDHNGIAIQPLAHFDIEARVLSRKNYSGDEESKLSPVDLALGWGNMSDEKVLNMMEIKQGNRWYHWRIDEFIIPRKEIIHSSANMHLVPANPQIAGAIADVVKGNLVKITGYLIEADSGGRKWRSSLTRSDSGAHACELIYVQDFKIL
ncbi:MAG: hypothetical protein KTR32_25605 [Granulosicoccus sp.]|nr:hypothetical protein [Granulosicoccus sp.]